MILLPEDWWHQFAMGILYIFFNAYGQYMFGTPLYPQTNWVLNPIGALLTLIAMATAQAFLYYLWAKGLLVFKKWIDNKV